MDEDRKQQLLAAARGLPRQRLTELVELTGSAAYDDDEVEDLVELVADAVIAGDLSEELLEQG